MSLTRFLEAQEGSWEDALAELRAGRKDSHWMWWIFPQLRGLGRSHRATFYGIEDAGEARAYARHPVLAPRLIACAEAVLGHPGVPIVAIMGGIDATKLQSCATLFRATGPDDMAAVMQRVLDVFYGGAPCRATEALLEG